MKATNIMTARNLHEDDAQDRERWRLGMGRRQQLQNPRIYIYAESNGKLRKLFVPSKPATLVPEFTVEDLSLGRTASLVTEFTVKDLSLGRTL